jgi:DNA-binding NarL/FixJ family response regulator
MNEIKILVVDDHAVMRMGLSSILNANKGLCVVGEAEDGRSAIAMTAKLTPDVILMDIMMPGMDGAEATVQIRKNFPDVKILIFTNYDAVDAIAHALAAGANGAILKNIDYKDLVSTIRTVAKGGRIIAPEIQRSIKESPPVEELSEKQLSILRSIIRGLTDADIACEHSMTANGVRDAITKIYTKLGAANRAEAVAIALRKQLLPLQ